MNDNAVSKGYSALKWGILLSALHINVNFSFGGLQIIPEFIACALFAYIIGAMNKKGGQRYFTGIVRETIYLLVFSIVQFIFGFLFGYTSVVGLGFVVASFLYEVLVYADILNVTVKLYKDNGDIKAADKLRKDRVTFIKGGMALAIITAVAMVPALSTWLNYTCFSLTLVYKIWLSMVIQNVSKKQLRFFEN